ncbi:hypothetical protein M9Y10_045591 [Tritrichomonas musculus]|uniref:Uncharacterized protein n=1 Tax=Tritrichomonas musculus TaxID=1915356 RepID=A0ABR2JVN3_9EUKA
MDVKIIEPITHYIKEFNTPDDFNSWYKAHKEELDSLTTHKLNKMYFINGYRITRIKNVLSLKKARQTQQKQSPTNELNDNTEYEQRFIAIENDISDMSEDIKNIKIALQSIQEYFTNME